MQQQTVFPVLSVQTTDQATLAKDLAVITNILGLKVIEIEQRDPRIRQLEGFMVCKYKEIPQSDEELMAAATSTGHTEQQRYPHEIVGGTVKFLQNPSVRRAIGTGRVAFLIDDDMPVPPGAMSGAKTGWNREALASNMNDPVACNFWYIVDDDIRREIGARAAAMKTNAERAKKEKEEAAKHASAMPFASQPSTGPTTAYSAAGQPKPAFADEAQNVGAASDPAVGRLVEAGVETPVVEPMVAPVVGMTSAEETERRIAGLTEKLNKMVDRIGALESENGALRTQNEELTKAAQKPRIGRPPKSKMAGGFAGGKAKV
jgi:hypothetical protein